MDCDDGDPCTVDSCNPAVGCINRPAGDGASCSDGDPCTTNDHCAAGACNGVPMACGPAELCEAGVCAAPVTGMRVIPEGSFWMGCNDLHDSLCNLDEKPQHQVWLGAHYIDLTEVTQDEYQACVSAGACVPTKTIGGCHVNSPNKGDRPANCMVHDGASQYCAWIGGRLPTEAEWERAARGGCELYPANACRPSMPLYPWGDEAPTCELASWTTSDAELCDTYGPGPVGSKPAGVSPYGLFDMAGSINEWVADWYGETYYKNSPTHDPTNSLFGLGHVVRGGAYGTSIASQLRASGRGTAPANIYIGFRCVRDLP